MVFYTYCEFCRSTPSTTMRHLISAIAMLAGALLVIVGTASVLENSASNAESHRMEASVR